MQNLTVTLVQANQVWEDKQANFDNYERLLDGVSTNLILLPEMFQTGFSMNAEQLAESENGESIVWLKSLSKKTNAAIYTSLIINDGSAFRNQGVFITPDGDVKRYNKRKTFGLAGEDAIYEAGDKEVIITYKGWKLQLQICYDLRFPEIVRNRIQPNLSAAYDVILYVANWPEKRAMHWNALLKSRAIENQSYVIGVNRVGTDNSNLKYSGDSQIVDALGEIYCIEPFKELICTHELEMEALDTIRKKLPFLRDINFDA